MRGRGRAVAVACVAMAGVAACGGGDEPAGPGPSAGTATGAAGSSAGTVTVMAPAPLKGALEKAGAAYQARYPGSTVTLNLGHVPALLAQISQGVPADVVVTPDEATMRQFQGKGLAAGTTVAVARNRLVLVVPAGNPAGVTGVASLGDDALTIAVCAAELPCGTLADRIAAKAGVTPAADSREPGGSPAVVTKIAAGEVDLGVAFGTDVRAANGKAAAVPLDDALGASVTVTAAALTSPADGAGADRFVSFLSTSEAAAAFAAAGFDAS